jgi:hypothetical protein
MVKQDSAPSQVYPNGYSDTIFAAAEQGRPTVSDISLGHPVAQRSAPAQSNTHITTLTLPDHTQSSLPSLTDQKVRKEERAAGDKDLALPYLQSSLVLQQKLPGKSGEMYHYWSECPVDSDIETIHRSSSL